MPRLTTEATKRNLLRRVRRQRLNYITILPSLITVLNGLCGFTAVVFASEGAKPGLGHFSYFSLAGYMVLLAMIADTLDGRLARISKSTSSFGGQLDSLCDIVSFGVAPAFLMLKVLEHKLAGFVVLNRVTDDFLQRFIWLAAAAYVSCAAIRLARFNVENEEDESSHMSFIGLPTPAAAGVIVSVVIFHQKGFPGFDGIVYALPFLSMWLAVMMVSKLRYPHIVNQYIRGRKPFGYLIRALLLAGLIFWQTEPALVLIFCTFAGGSFVKWLYYRVIRRRESREILLGRTANVEP
ncbi:MAG: CDP-alcohol phosphatidyltransferase family protein [Phycisphaerales bacterium]|nr:MAG: CDP-alcohol phosphatidyltransferase family protein [Phycisphaerales bacterium]